MDTITPQYLCDAVAIVDANTRFYISVFKVEDGMDFVSGRGEIKHGSPRRHWSAQLLKYEIGMASGAEQVRIVVPMRKSTVPAGVTHAMPRIFLSKTWPLKYWPTGGRSFAAPS